MRAFVRSQVLWYGRPPNSALEAELEHRDLSVKVSSAVTHGDLNVSCAAVFVFDITKKGESIGRIRPEGIRDMLDYGLRIFVVGADEASVKTVQSKLPRGTPTGAVRFTTAGFQLAEEIRRWDPGHPCSEDLIIMGDAARASSERLLRRAFHDCRRITLEKLAGGLTNAEVFAVYAEFLQGYAGPYPLPFFAKIDLRERTQKEREAYVNFVTNFVPFTQRPNLDNARCIDGFGHGILVGDFVEHSVSLTNVIDAPTRREVIHSLFDDALRGWRRQAFVEGRPEPSAINISEALAIDLRESKIPTEVAIAAAISGGATMIPSQLKEQLDSDSVRPYRIGPIHGDLNTENVRARGNEAILIDFYKTRTGPLVADLASLEVAAAFRLTAKQVMRAASPLSYFESWGNAVRALYMRPCILDVPPPHMEPSELSWLWDLCRELRLIGRAIDATGTHYAYALVAYLLRESSFQDNPQYMVLQRCISANAYACAERLLRDLRNVAQ